MWWALSLSLRKNSFLSLPDPVFGSLLNLFPFWIWGLLFINLFKNMSLGTNHFLLFLEVCPGLGNDFIFGTCPYLSSIFWRSQRPNRCKRNRLLGPHFLSLFYFLVPRALKTISSRCQKTVDRDFSFIKSSFLSLSL